MSRNSRIGIGRQGICSLDQPLLVRGDVVSVELSDGRTVEFPESWGLVHDPSGACSDSCEVYVCPYTVSGPLSRRIDTEIHKTAVSYWGEGYQLLSGRVVLPTGPWQRVGVIVRVYYDRYGELKSKYQHPFKDKSAILYKQSRNMNGRQRAYRISLPDGCVVDSHGFVWP